MLEKIFLMEDMFEQLNKSFNDESSHSQEEAKARCRTRLCPWRGGWDTNAEGGSKDWTTPKSRIKQEAATDGVFLYGDVSGCRQSF